MKTTTDTDTATGTTMTEDAPEEEWVPDLIEEIVQLFEDFLWVHSGKVHNTEPKPDEWAKDDIIYGSQKDELINDLIVLLSGWELV